jgi:hypothetical protein
VTGAPQFDVTTAKYEGHPLLSKQSPIVVGSLSLGTVVAHLESMSGARWIRCR